MDKNLRTAVQLHYILLFSSFVLLGTSPLGLKGATGMIALAFLVINAIKPVKPDNT